MKKLTVTLPLVRRTVFSFTAALGVLCCGTASARSPKANPMVERLDRAVDSALSQGRMVGTVVIVMRDGKTVYQRAAGFADREAGRKMTVNQIFRLASVTKTITSTTVMALVERGLLDLDDPASKWLPHFRPQAPDGSTPPITIRQLLTHTSGLTYAVDPKQDPKYFECGVENGTEVSNISLDEEVSRISCAGLRFKPGTDWNYGVSIDVLGAVISQATKLSLPAAVRKYVTSPLGLRDTGFVVTDRKRLAKAYANGPTQPVPITDGMKVDFPGWGALIFGPSRHLTGKGFPSGGGGMVSTGPEIAKLLETVRTGGEPVVSRSTASAMMANQVGSMPISFLPGWGFGFGGGVVMNQTVAHVPMSVGTWSWSGAYGNSWFVDPAKKLTVVTMGNTTPEGDSGQFVMDVRAAVYGQTAKE